MQRGLSGIGLFPVAVIFSIHIKAGQFGMKVLQTWRLIKLYSADSPTGFEVRSVKSMGSEVAHKTDLHLTHQLEMIISRCITVSFFFFFSPKDDATSLSLIDGLLSYTRSCHSTHRNELCILMAVDMIELGTVWTRSMPAQYQIK